MPHFTGALRCAAHLARRRRSWCAVPVLIVAAAVLWCAVSYHSAENRARRRVDELGGFVGGATHATALPGKLHNWPVGRLLFRLTQRMKVTSVVVEGRAATDADLALFLAGFPQIEQLDVSSTSVSDSGLTLVGGLPSLFRLCARHTRVTDAGVAAIANCPQLANVDLDGTQITDAALADLARLPRLNQLRVSQTQLSDAGLAHLSGSNLQRLDVTGTNVTDAGAAAFEAANPQCTLVR